MRSIQRRHASDNRLRFVFNNAVVAGQLAANATFGDVARKLSELPRTRYGDPLAIDVTLEPAPRASAGNTRTANPPSIGLWRH